jgi:hypothetical protein
MASRHPAMSSRVNRMLDIRKQHLSRMVELQRRVELVGEKLAALKEIGAQYVA